MSNDLGAICSGVMVMPTGDRFAMPNPMGTSSNAVGPLPKAHIIAADTLRENIRAMGDTNPINAVGARQSFERWLGETFPEIGDFYMSSTEMPGLSIGEAKLVKLGLLNR